MYRVTCSFPRSFPISRPLFRSGRFHRYSVIASSAADSSSSFGPPARPSNAETAKTIVSTVNHGTLSTLSDDGTPLGTYVAFVLDDKGSPVLRLRSDAVHKRNLELCSKCSLFVQAPEEPARRLARVTLIGDVTLVQDEELETVRSQYQAKHPEAKGIDQLREKDKFGFLNVNKVFYVGGLSGEGAAEVVAGEDFIGSDPDPLRFHAIEIVKEWNQ
eukprot:g4911.t1